jgi:hypothetical protein
MRWKLTLVAVLVAVGSPAWAQMQSRPTDPPLVTAANESWYVLREPVQFAGDLYAPAGPPVFFNGNTMVRSGHYNGVPLYTDTTIEPFSVVLVPISRGLLQPYARMRPSASPVIMAAVSPTAPPLSPGAISVYTPETRVYTPETAGTTGVVGPAAGTRAVEQERPVEQEIVGTTGYLTATRRPAAVPIVSMRRPESNDGVWIMFAGEKWVPAGTAVPFTIDFVRVGEYAGFPVFARRDFSQEIIYMPSRAGFIAPYRLRNP